MLSFPQKMLLSPQTTVEVRIKNPRHKTMRRGKCVFLKNALFLHESSDFNGAVCGQTNHVGSRSIGFDIDFKLV